MALPMCLQHTREGYLRDCTSEKEWVVVRTEIAKSPKGELPGAFLYYQKV